MSLPVAGLLFRTKIPSIACLRLISLSNNLRTVEHDAENQRFTMKLPMGIDDIILPHYLGTFLLSFLVRIRSKTVEIVNDPKTFVPSRHPRQKLKPQLGYGSFIVQGGIVEVPICTHSCSALSQQ